jgi:hypothetical protein
MLNKNDVDLIHYCNELKAVLAKPVGKGEAGAV